MGFESPATPPILQGAQLPVNHQHQLIRVLERNRVLSTGFHNGDCALAIEFAGQENERNVLVQAPNHRQGAICAELLFNIVAR